MCTNIPAAARQLSLEQYANWKCNDLHQIPGSWGLGIGQKPSRWTGLLIPDPACLDRVLDWILDINRNPDQQRYRTVPYRPVYCASTKDDTKQGGIKRRGGGFETHPHSKKRYKTSPPSHSKLKNLRVRSATPKNSVFRRFHCFFGIQNISIYCGVFGTLGKILYRSKYSVLHIRLFAVFRKTLYFTEILYPEIQSFKTPFPPNKP